MKLINVISATQTVDSLDAQELQERFFNIALDYQTLHLQDASPKTTGEGGLGRNFPPRQSWYPAAFKSKGPLPDQDLSVPSIHIYLLPHLGP